ncbi:MAG TPA: hypothetical protein VGM67_16895 [Gemmatimonadaceae bacterium]|jgi:hypothetical protein
MSPNISADGILDLGGTTIVDACVHRNATFPVRTMYASREVAATMAAWTASGYALRSVFAYEVSPYLDPDGTFDLSRFLRDENERKEAEAAFGRAVAERRRLLRPVYERLGSWGWVAPPWGSEVLFENGGIWTSQAAADAYFLREYRKNRGRRLRQLFTDMERYPVLTSRAELLRQVRSGMRKRMFLVCVPALFALLEAMLLEYAGLLATPTIRVMAVADSIVEAAEPKEDYEILHWLGWVAVRAFVHSLFEKRSFDQPAPPRANRHWIMHGRSLLATGELECLQLLQAIESIAMDHYYGLN